MEAVAIQYLHRYLEMRGIDILEQEELDDYTEYICRNYEGNRIFVWLPYNRIVDRRVVIEFVERILITYDSVDTLVDGSIDFSNQRKIRERCFGNMIFAREEFTHESFNALADYGIEAHSISTFDRIEGNLIQNGDLYLSNTPINLDALGIFEKSDFLENLHLNNDVLLQGNFASLTHFCDQLQTVTIKSINPRSNLDLGSLKNHQNLSTISVIGHPLRKIDLYHISHIPRLKTLILADCRLQMLDLIPLAQCTDLIWLYLDENKLFSIDVSPLAYCQKLSVLDLSNNVLREIDLTHLVKCANITKVNLKGNLLSAIDLSPLSKFSEKSRSPFIIDLSDNYIQEIDFVPLTNLKRVISVKLQGNPLDEVDFTPISDKLLSLSSIRDLECNIILPEEFKYRFESEDPGLLNDLQDRITWNSSSPSTPTTRRFEENLLLPPFYCAVCSQKHIAGTTRMQCNSCGRYICTDAFSSMTKAGRMICPMCDGQLLPVE